MDRIPFSQQLAYLERGALDVETTELLAELVIAVTATGKPGKLTLTIDLKHDARMNCMEITGSVKAKIPEPARRRTFMFPTGAGELLRDDPEQQKLFSGPAAVPVAEGNDRETA